VRLYKTGTSWCVWRWTVTDSEYITRLHLVKTPWFAVCLHWINKPDPEPFLHDHPVSFLSIILRGAYTERRWRLLGPGEQRLTHCWFNYVRASSFDRHSIVDVIPGTLTLALMGPKTREWGFHTPAGWTYWKDYHRTRRTKGHYTVQQVEKASKKEGI
jgi:hypothetical protein